MTRLTRYGIACAVVLGFALMSVRERAWAEQAAESESLIIAGERISVPTPEGLVLAPPVSGDLKDTLDAMVGPGTKRLFVTPEDHRSISAGSEPKLAHYALAQSVVVDGKALGVSSADSFATFIKGFDAQQERLLEQARSHQRELFELINANLAKEGKKPLPLPTMEFLGVVHQDDHSLSVLTRSDASDENGRVSGTFSLLTCLTVSGRLIRLLEFIEVTPQSSKEGMVAQTKAWIERIVDANGGIVFAPLPPPIANPTGTTMQDLIRAQQSVTSATWVLVLSIPLSGVTLWCLIRIARSRRRQQFAEDQAEKKALRNAGAD
jgi:hypothetical protein